MQAAPVGVMALEEALWCWWVRVRERCAAMLDDAFIFQLLKIPANIRREALQARMTIGISVSVDGLALESRPLKGLAISYRTPKTCRYTRM